MDSRCLSPYAIKLDRLLYHQALVLLWKELNMTTTVKNKLKTLPAERRKRIVKRAKDLIAEELKLTRKQQKQIVR